MDVQYTRMLGHPVWRSTGFSARTNVMYKWSLPCTKIFEMHPKWGFFSTQKIVEEALSVLLKVFKNVCGGPLYCSNTPKGGRFGSHFFFFCLLEDLSCLQPQVWTSNDESGKKKKNCQRASTKPESWLERSKGRWKHKCAGNANRCIPDVCVKPPQKTGS